ncbi:MAG: crosslink repair DNA glycosylase YcaQ family protein [Nannocystaceae bacterium]
MSAKDTIDLPRLRAFWADRQGLLHLDPKRTPAGVLEETGWARSVGGVAPYLTLFARAGIGRARADKAAADLEIYELPSARGCTYVIPRRDFPLALAAASLGGDDPEIKAAKKHLGLTDAELDRLSQGVLRALERGALDPAGLKEVLGDAVRNLGAEGKKRGVTTTLPLALGHLQRRGEIRRQPVSGRLDEQRYAYVRWSPSPLAGAALTPGDAAVLLARRYFEWIGVASAANFQWFSGLGVKAAKAALEPLELEPIAEGSPLLGRAAEVAALRAFKAPKDPVYRLVAGIDGLVLLRRSIGDHLEPADQKRKVAGDRGVAELGGLQDLTSHAIVDRGRIVGLWEFEPSSGTIAWASFGKANAALKEEVARTERFIQDELGDARSFSLDSPERRQPRIDALRAYKG